MKLPLPKAAKEYPFYIFMYWLFIWAVLFLYSSFLVFSSLTPDGKYVEKTDCIQKQMSGGACIKYSAPFYVPVGVELKYEFVSQGILIGAVTIIIGGFLMLKDRKKK